MILIINFRLVKICPQKDVRAKDHDSKKPGSAWNVLEGIHKALLILAV